jgi:hypothetical protein
MGKSSPAPPTDRGLDRGTADRGTGAKGPQYADKYEVTGRDGDAVLVRIRQGCWLSMITSDLGYGPEDAYGARKPGVVTPVIRRGESGFKKDFNKELIRPGEVYRIKLPGKPAPAPQPPKVPKPKPASPPEVDPEDLEVPTPKDTRTTPGEFLKESATEGDSPAEAAFWALVEELGASVKDLHRPDYAHGHAAGGAAACIEYITGGDYVVETTELASDYSEGFEEGLTASRKKLNDSARGEENFEGLEEYRNWYASQKDRVDVADIRRLFDKILVAYAQAEFRATKKPSLGPAWRRWALERAHASTRIRAVPRKE